MGKSVLETIDILQQQISLLQKELSDNPANELRECYNCIDLIDRNELLASRPEYLNEDMNDELLSAEHKGWNACNKEWFEIVKNIPRFNIFNLVREMNMRSATEEERNNVYKYIQGISEKTGVNIFDV